MNSLSGLSFMRKFIAMTIVLAAGLVFACAAIHPYDGEAQSSYTAVSAVPAGTIVFVQTEETLEEVQEQSRAERVMRALVLAYPGRVLRAEYRDGDWAALLRGTWFFYADGRLMPEHLRAYAANYRPIAFYNNYSAEMPVWTPPTQEQINRFREHSAVRIQLPPRAPYFFDTLYRASSREEAYMRVRQIRFLGRNVTVHYAILGELALVEERILEAARTDSSVQTWIDEIGRMYGWNWRNVGGTQSRSFHAYGVAIDIIPRNLHGKAVFWGWSGPNWWNIPIEGRHHPPEAVIRAFELYGFVWGGKWSHFDTIHFEFRPEVFILNGLELATLR